MEDQIAELQKQILDLQNQVEELSKPKPLGFFKLVIKGDKSIIDTRYYQDKSRLEQTINKRQNRCYDLFAYQLYSDNNWKEKYNNLNKKKN